MRRAATVLAAALALAATAPGCGGEDRLTREEFIATGNRLCVEQSRKIGDLQRRTRDRAQLLREAGEISAESQRRFRDLRPPEELQDPYDQLLDENDRFFKGSKTQPELERFTRRMRELLRELGLTRCSNG